MKGNFHNYFLDFYRGHIACLPPSTGRVAPVMKEESSDAKNAILLATSSGFPGLPRACVALLLSMNCRENMAKYHKIIRLSALEDTTTLI